MSSVRTRRAQWRIVLACVVGMAAQTAFADVSISAFNDPDETPADAICWILGSSAVEGVPQEFDAKAPGASMFCPQCLTDPVYSANVPLRRIEKRLIPPPSDAGNYDCDGNCPRWLLRMDAHSDAALMLVRVEVPTLCGATGWCPGLIYEHSRGVWTLVGDYGSNEADELCIRKNDKSTLQLWLTPLAEASTATELLWRP